VFSSAGEAQLRQQVVRQVACLCGVQNAVRLEDVVGTIYCQSCGAEIDLAEKLPARRLAKQPETQRTVAAPTTARSPRAFGWLLGTASALTCVGVLIWIGVTAFRQPSRITRASAMPVWVEPPESTADGAAQEFDPARLSRSLIEALAADPQPFRALATAYAWRQGLRDHAVAEADPRFAALAAVAQKLLADRVDVMLKQIEELPHDPRPDRAWETGVGWRELLRAYDVPETDSRCAALDPLLVRLEELANTITLEMIESLTREPDVTEALVQAQIWAAGLADRQVPESDPRRVRLSQLIAKFTEQLAPEEPGPPPYFAQFNQLLDAARDQLGRRELDAAAESIVAAEKLLEAHPDDLAPLAKRLLFLKQRLEAFRSRGRGIDGVRTQFATAASTLTEAERLRDAGDAGAACQQVSAAVELHARARREAFGLSLSQPQIDELEKLYRQLEPRLRFASGWRAVLDAEACDRDGDTAVRDWAVGRVGALLPGLPEPQIAPWLKRVERWKSAATLTLAAVASQARTSQGKTILLREHFENLLEHIAQAQQAAASEALQALLASLPPEDDRDPQLLSRIGELALDFVEPRVLECLQTAEKNPKAAASQLAQARQAVNAVAHWSADPRYLALQAAVDGACRGVIERQLKVANDLADNDSLNEAIAALREVEPLAVGSELHAELASLSAEWNNELELRKNKQAENDAWQHIQTLLADAHQAPQAEAELRAFVRRYADSGRRKLAESQLAKLVASDERTATIERALAAVERDYVAARFDAARKAWSQLQRTYPADSLPKSLQRAWQDQRRQISALPERAQAELAQLGKLRRLMDVEALLKVREILPGILAMDPANSEAIALAERLARSSEAWAKRLLSSARLMKRAKNPKYKELAGQVQRLNPDGPHGREAGRLLAGR
jgi:hypothetical protein